MEARLIATAVALAIVIPSAVVAAPTISAPTVAAIEQRMAADPERAIAMARSARTALGEGDARQRATLLWLEGEAQVRIGDPLGGLRTLDKARTLATRSGAPPRLAADILLSQGSALTDAGRITDALIALQRAHDMFVRLDDRRSRARALILIALLYGSGHDYETALRYFQQAGEAYPSDLGLAVAADNGRGAALMSLGRLDEAEVQFAAALDAAGKLRSAPAIAQSLGNLTQAHLRAGKVDAAADSIARALRVAQRSEAAPVRPQLMALAAGVALRQGDVARAERLIRARFAGTDLNNTILADRDAHEVAYQVLRAAGDTSGALDHAVALKRLDDQATDIARSTSAALATARFDYANQELRITRLKAAALARTIAYEREVGRTQRLILYGVVGATLLVITLLVAGLWAIGRSRNRERAANRELAASNAQLERLSRAKTEFLATTSHEIRTPLNGILGMTQVMLAEGGRDAATRERLEVVHSAGETMRALVDDILDTAKIDSGKMTVEHVPFDLHATIAAAAQLWREPAAAKGVRFDIDTDAAPQWIMGDAARLRQIVFNLLSNAVKFTERGTIALSVAAGDGRVRITVADSGIGIDEEAQRIIFDSFRQADAGTTRRFGGTGLGLSISRSLAQAMGGDVSVDSRPGAGARFTLDLPCVAAEPPRTEEVSGGIVVVERNPIVRAMFRTLLADHGPVVFADAATVVAEIAHRRPALVLADTGTTGVDAAPLAAMVATGVPIVLLTDTENDTNAAVGERSGLTKVIQKPVSKQALLDAISDMLRQNARHAA